MAIDASGPPAKALPNDLAPEVVVFRWPGLGALTVSSLLDRDGPVIMGTVIVSSGAIVLANLLVDFLENVGHGTSRPLTRHARAGPKVAPVTLSMWHWQGKAATGALR